MAALGFSRHEERLSATAGPAGAAYKGRMLTYRRGAAGGDGAAPPRPAQGAD